MQVTIVHFTQDTEGDWIAEFSCGHHVHMRHDPPWQNRPWVIQNEGRKEKIGMIVLCKNCDEKQK